jgi:HK97 family phage major capsid protein
MNVGTTVGGAWVGEGGVIPLVKGSFGSKRLYAYKLAGIIPITKELQRTSDPQAVAVMSEMLRQFLSNLLDASMIDASAEVTGVRPAGLLNGVTPIAGAAGGGYEALRADLEAVTNAFTAAGVGNGKNVLLVPASKAFRLSTMVNALGQLIFPNGSGTVLGFQTIPSQFVAANTAIAVAADKFASAIDPPELDSSEEATLTMADAGAAAPTQAGDAAGGGALGTAKQVIPDGGIPVAGGAGASTTGYTALSLFQSWLIGLRLVIPASYGVTRAGAVQQLTGITW